ncbi:MAG: hypothetical protein KJZ75_02370 [Hyphomonadaceae bacterium]|nr:hypothetical protein [Hyphomonadaceae bacterium]
MGAVEHYLAGQFVSHPEHGPARVLGVQSATVAGERLDVLALALLSPNNAVVQIPLSKLVSVPLRSLSEPEARAQAIEQDRRQPTRRQLWGMFAERSRRKGSMVIAMRHR